MGESPPLFTKIVERAMANLNKTKRKGMNDYENHYVCYTARNPQILH